MTDDYASAAQALGNTTPLGQIASYGPDMARWKLRTADGTERRLTAQEIDQTKAWLRSREHDVADARAADDRRAAAQEALQGDAAVALVLAVLDSLPIIPPALQALAARLKETK